MKVKFNTLLEGSHYDTDAAKILVKAGLFNEEEARAIIKDLYENKIHAFVHADDLGTDIKKYLKGIARMCVNYANGDPNLAKEFLNDSIDTFDTYLNYVKEVRKKQDNPTKFDSDFMNKISYQEVKDFAEKYQKELDKKSKDELSKMEFDSSNYELVPINSYEEFHSKFGGRLTGDGSSDKAAGRGGTAWCHANGEDTYNSWINRDKGGNKFFVLMNKDFKDIPFNEKTNEELVGKDDYGNSLIAILVDRYGNLKYATLRCNHERKVPNADKQYKTYAELSKVARFNVEKRVQELGNFEENPLKDGVYYYEGGEVLYALKKLVKKVIVKDGVTEIGVNTFQYCTSLESITIPDNVTRIGNYAFCGCELLESITIPNSVAVIEGNTFQYCTSLKSITIPNSVTRIGDNAFRYCTSLESITIPNSVTEIEGSAFYGCGSLQSIILPESVDKLGRYVFGKCTSLHLIEAQGDFTMIGTDAFDTGNKNTVVYCNPKSYVYEYCKEKNIKTDIGSNLEITDYELWEFLVNSIVDYCDYDKEIGNILVQRPLGEFIDEEIPYSELKELKKLIDTGKFEFSTEDDNLLDYILNLVSEEKIENNFYRELLYQMKLKAKREGKQDIVKKLSGINSKTFIQLLRDAEIIYDDGEQIDTQAYYEALEDYFGY